MKAKVTTAVLLIICSLSIGWLSYQNLMWAVWGKQNSWYEYLGFWGCPVMLISGIVAVKNIWVGSYLGVLGYAMMLFFYAPALTVTLQRIINDNVTLGPIQATLLLLTVALPLLTIVRLCMNIIKVRSEKRA